MFIRVVMTFSYLLLLAITPVLPAVSSEHRIEIPIKISSLPEDAWGKSRIFSNLEGQTFVLRDLGHGPFNDASMWKISINQALPFGRKILSFDLIVGEKHKPLWGDQLFQPIINGVEAEPALDENGAVSFNKIVSDGRGFIPARSQKIALSMSESELSLSSFALMTAGAENYEIKLSNMKVVVWPQSHVQRPHVSTLGYIEGSSKTAYIEWYDRERRALKTKTKIYVNNKASGRIKEIDISLPKRRTAISGSYVNAIDLSDLTAGEYDLIVPSFGEYTRETKASFEVNTGNSHIKKLRDQAWGAFYWITSGPNGPYPKAHQQDLGAIDFDVPTETKDVSGGWFDAGDYGKYSVNGAYSVSLMLITGLIASDVLSHDINKVGNTSANVADWLRVADTELSWLYKMQRADGAVYHKATTRKWPSATTAPEDDRATKWLMPVTTTATANFAAAMSLAAKLYLTQEDEIYQKRGMDFKISAEKALNWLDENRELKMIDQSYEGDEYGGAYDDDDDSDERFFAHAAYAALTENNTAFATAYADLKNLKPKMEAREYDVNWRTVDLLGVWALATSNKLDSRTKKSVMKILRSASNNWRNIQAQSSWGVPVSDDGDLYWGSNGVFATIGWHWALWSHLSGEKAFIDSAEMQLHYFFGLNPLNKTYVTGQLPNSVKAAYFGPSTSGRIELPAGFISGGPNSSGLDGNAPPMRSYIDDNMNFTTNEVAINWQSAWALYASLLAAKTH